MHKYLLLIFLVFSLQACVGDELLFGFNNVPERYLHNTIEVSTNPYQLPYAASQKKLPEKFSYNGFRVYSDAFIERTGTGGLLVLKDNKIVFEKYYAGSNANTRFTSWSVAKSFTSALIGLAIEKGYINSVNDLVSTYVPELSNTAYHDVTIKNVLQMSSGVDYVESYADPSSDALRHFLALANSNEEFIYSLKDKAHPAGTYNNYASSDTQVLGIVLARATGQTVSAFMQAHLWQPMGAEKQAIWVTDTRSVEATYCCLSAALKDYAKFGLLYLNKGQWQGHQLLPAQWVADSIDTSEPQTVPGDNPQSSDDWGYGYQWWIPDTGPDYMAIGIFNQFIYINPETNIVIVKNSANPEYLLNDMEADHLAFFRKISNEFSKEETTSSSFSLFSFFKSFFR